MRFTVGPVDTMWNVGIFNRIKAEIPITSRTLCVQRHIPDADGCGNSVDNDIFIHAIVPRHVETVALLSRRKDELRINVTMHL